MPPFVSKCVFDLFSKVYLTSFQMYIISIPVKQTPFKQIFGSLAIYKLILPSLLSVPLFLFSYLLVRELLLPS